MKDISLLTLLAGVFLALLANCEAINSLAVKSEHEQMNTMKYNDVCLSAYYHCRRGFSREKDSIGKSLLPPNPTLQHNNRIATITAYSDYRLSFYITPRGTVAGWGGIFQFTAGGACCEFGTRAPGVWFFPGTTRLHVRIGDAKDGNWGIDADEALPLHIRTKVTLECRGKNVKLIVGTKEYTATQPTSRYSGNVIVYAGTPWEPPVNAVIDNLSYTNICRNGVTSQDKVEGMTEQVQEMLEDENEPTALP